jgi:hypothetical protein
MSSGTSDFKFPNPLSKSVLLDKSILEKFREKSKIDKYSPDRSFYAGAVDLT